VHLSWCKFGLVNTICAMNLKQAQKIENIHKSEKETEVSNQ
jgi:hypothetical protein